MEHRINGVDVSFPYEPYDIQIDYMSKVIDACENQRYAMLESPTGTGKTLSLLCAALSWREKTSFPCQIVYSSRTHTQLANVIDELKKTRFRPKVVHIGSRTNLCINNAVNKLPNHVLISRCHDLRSKKQCPYSGEQKLAQHAKDVLTEKASIKEYVDICIKKQICPYYCSQVNAELADLVLAPYQYIVDPRIRNFMPVSSILGNVLIFDEAHNFADLCSDTLSSHLYFKQVEDAAKVLGRIVNIPSTVDIGKGTTLNMTTFGDLKSKVILLSHKLSTLQQSDQDFRECLDEASKTSFKNITYVKKDAAFIYNLMASVGIDYGNAPGLSGTIEQITQHSIDLGIGANEFGPIQAVGNFLDNLYPNGQRMQRTLDDCYAVCLTSDNAISITCFSPEIGFKKIAQLMPRTIILTSGTLSPMASLEAELNTEFPIKLENEHIADPEQFLVAISTSGPTQQRFQFTYQNRKDKLMRRDLYEAASSLFDAYPGGSLMFFPSFTFLDEIHKNIKSIKTRKMIFIEPRDSSKQEEVLQQYRRESSKGAAMLAVCRGKLSEGLDFADDYARCVSVVGVPFPNLTDFRIELKKSWLDGRRKGLGSQWYLENAMRAVNQSIGRAIRHRNDYAVVVLFDERYIGFKGMLSKWVQHSVRIFDDWSALQEELDGFFRARPNGYVPKKLPKRTRSADPIPTDIAPAEKPVRKPAMPVIEAPLPSLIINKPKKRKIAPSILDSILGASKAKDPKKGSTERVPPGAAKILGISSKAPPPVPSSKAQPAQANEGPKQCVYCKKEGVKMRTMRCGHLECEICFKFHHNSPFKLPCPICSK